MKVESKDDSVIDDGDVKVELKDDIKVESNEDVKVELKEDLKTEVNDDNVVNLSLADGEAEIVQNATESEA